MASRTTHSVVHFPASFTLGGVDDVQPPGDYAIDDDEELIDGISWPAYRRVATFIYLPSVGSNSRTSRPTAIDRSELEAALQQDRTRNAHDGSA